MLRFLCFSVSLLTLRLLLQTHGCSFPARNRTYTQTATITQELAHTLSWQGVTPDAARVRSPPLERHHRPRPATIIFKNWQTFLMLPNWETHTRIFIAHFIDDYE